MSEPTARVPANRRAHDLGGFGDGMQVHARGRRPLRRPLRARAAPAPLLDASDPTDLRLVGSGCRRRAATPTRCRSPTGCCWSTTSSSAVATRTARHGGLRPGRPVRPRSRSAGSTRPAAACTGSSGPVGGTPTSRRSRRASTTGSGWSSTCPTRRNPVEAGRWWWPGQWVDGEQPGLAGGQAVRRAPRPGRRRPAPTSATATPGLVVLDISDVVDTDPARAPDLGDRRRHPHLPAAARVATCWSSPTRVVTDRRAGEPHWHPRRRRVRPDTGPRWSVCARHRRRRLLRSRAAFRAAQPAREPAGQLPQRRRWSSRRTSTPGCGSTTSPMPPSTRSRWRTGCPTRLPARRPRRSTTVRRSRPPGSA